MPKFAVILTRDITESIVIEVEAESADAAEVNALATLENMAAPIWAVDDSSHGSTPPYVSDAHEIVGVELDAAQTHQMEQDRVTAACELGTCDHADCRRVESWSDCANRIMDETEANTDDNRRRAVRVLRTIYPAYDDADLKEAVTDVLSDLRHLCGLMGWDFDEIDLKAVGAYRWEAAELGAATDEHLRQIITSQLT